MGAVKEVLDGAGNLVKRTKCEVYSRVCGYIRPAQNWNEGKQSEYADRKEFLCDGCGEERKPIVEGDLKRTIKKSGSQTILQKESDGTAKE